MRKRLFITLVALGLLVAGMVVPAAWADSHGEILGIQWQWTQLVETQPASQSVIADSENYVLVLNEDGSANLKADCNQVQWTYTVEGDTISFNTLGPSTLAFCGEDSSDQIFLEKLGLAGTWRESTCRRIHFWIRPRIFHSMGSCQASSTISWSRSGTRASSETDIEARSTLVRMSSGRYSNRSWSIICSASGPSKRPTLEVSRGEEPSAITSSGRNQ